MSINANVTKNDEIANPTMPTAKNCPALYRKRSVWLPCCQRRGRRFLSRSMEKIPPNTSEAHTAKPTTPSSEPAWTYELCGAPHLVPPAPVSILESSYVHSAILNAL